MGGYMRVEWVKQWEQCQEACQSSSSPQACVGVEYHPTPVESGLYKCEVHFEELSATQMSVFQCWAAPTCRNAHDCPSGHKNDSLGISCSPSTSSAGDMADCSNQLCCVSEVSVSHAGQSPMRGRGTVACAMAVLAVVVGLGV